MKKFWSILICLALVLSLAACSSPLGNSLRRYEEKYGAYELDLTKVFSAEEGYHHPRVTWGESMQEVQNRTYASIENVSGYAEGGVAAYQIDGLYMLLLGRKNDASMISTDDDGICDNVAAVFQADAEKDTEMSLDELYTQFSGNLKKEFGEPAEATDSREVNGTVVRYTTLYWSYVRADGKETQMQLSKAVVSTATQPSYLTLSFALIPEKTEEAAE